MAAAHETAGSRGRLDLMFNNAGIGLAGYAHEFSLAHWQRVIDIYLFGVIHGIRAAYPLMLDQGHGHIVNRGSRRRVWPWPWMV